MKGGDQALVQERLLELEGWAEYIFEALHLDQRNEPTRIEMLKEIIDPLTLRQLREISWSMRDKLHVVTTQLELSRPAVKTMD